MWKKRLLESDAFNDLRVRRPSRLLLQRISQSRCAPSWLCAPIDSNSACRLACTRMGLRNAPKSAPHAQSSGTDANRHRVIAGDAWICGTWDFAALGRGNTPENALELQMKEAPRLILFNGYPRFDWLRPKGAMARLLRGGTHDDYFDHHRLPPAGLASHARPNAFAVVATE